MIRRIQPLFFSQKDSKEEKKHISVPFSYKISEVTPHQKEVISSSIRQLKFSDPPQEEEDIGTQIESTIKKIHNFIIPAISLELKDLSSNEQMIEFQSDDLKSLFSMFGEIKFIDITPSLKKAYVLYKHYFSAIYAFDTIKEILGQKNSENQIIIELISEKKSCENPQTNDTTPIRLNLKTECQAYVPKAMKNQSQPYYQLISSSDQYITPYEKTVDDFTQSPIPKNQMTNSIKFNTFSSRNYMYKYVTNYNIQIENDTAFQVTRRIIGKNGSFLKKIIFDSCINYNDYTTKVRLRGKGSGYKEGQENRESNEPLQLCVSSLNLYTYNNCCQMLEVFLQRLYYDYYRYTKLHDPNAPIQLDICKYEFVVNRFGN